MKKKERKKNLFSVTIGIPNVTTICSQFNLIFYLFGNQPKKKKNGKSHFSIKHITQEQSNTRFEIQKLCISSNGHKTLTKETIPNLQTLYHKVASENLDLEYWTWILNQWRFWNALICNP